jgi:hypothetical protein
MDISKFPTDNLYKFLAIFGLVIQILMFWYYDKIVSEAVTLQTEILADTDFINGKKHSSLDLIEQLEELNNKAHIKNRDSIINLIVTENKKLAVYKDELSLAEKKRVILDEKKDYVHMWLKFAYVINAIGLILMVAGFLLWYHKLQKYQDIIIKNEAMKIKNEIEKDKVENAK